MTREKLISTLKIYTTAALNESTNETVEEDRNQLMEDVLSLMYKYVSDCVDFIYGDVVPKENRMNIDAVMMTSNRDDMPAVLFPLVDSKDDPVEYCTNVGIDVTVLCIKLTSTCINITKLMDKSSNEELLRPDMISKMRELDRELMAYIDLMIKTILYHIIVMTFDNHMDFDEEQMVNICVAVEYQENRTNIMKHVIPIYRSPYDVLVKQLKYCELDDIVDSLDKIVKEYNVEDLEYIKIMMEGDKSDEMMLYYNEDGWYSLSYYIDSVAYMTDLKEVITNIITSKKHHITMKMTENEEVKVY